jgi:DNA (cytosine-5)-methyltransferase 1
MEAISLFSGMGGDTLGMTLAGIKVIAYSEKEPVFRKTHEENFIGSKLIGDGDILNTTDAEFEVYKGIFMIFAGFPCQGFSNAGNKDEDDPRNNLYKEFLRATRVIRPKCFIGENVKGLLTKSKNGKKYIDSIRSDFEDLGYKVYTKVIKCEMLGLPQKRERLFIVGTLNGNFEFPKESVDNKISLNGIVSNDTSGAVECPKELFNEIPDDCIKISEIVDKMAGHPNLLKFLRIYSENPDYVVFKFGKRTPRGAEIIDISQGCKTIICSYSFCPRLFVPMKIGGKTSLRTLCIKELLQIQSFPKDFYVCGNEKQIITQIGNAAPPIIVQKITENLILCQA